MTDHTSKQFDSELEAIRTKVLQLGGLVEQQIWRAVEGLTGDDEARLNEVVQKEAQVNRLEVELDEACGAVLARRQPAASDLRMIVTVMKVAPNLERIGDEAEKIARMAKMIHEAGRMHTPRVELNHMATATTAMLRKVLDAFARLDAQSAAQVVRQDIPVDAEYQGVLRQLISFMIEDPRTISRSIELMFIAKALERIGDHTKNIAEFVVYLVKGRDVRHLDVDDVEREAAS
jgi:phosphate transport system protein